MAGSYLKQSTASQSRTLGPFLDDTDFVSEETGLTIANTDVKLMKNGAASANKNSGGGTHRVNGHYSFTFDATDTNTVGELEVSISVAGALPVWKTFWVLEEAIYDALFGASATGLLPANVTQISGDSTAADNLELMYDGTGYTDSTAPASRAQVDGIGAASGGSLNFANEADNVDAPIKSVTFVGTESSGTNTSVNFEDGVFHQISDTANDIDIVYQFDIGGSRTATELTWKGRLTGTNDTVIVQAYNGSGWDTLKNIAGQSNSAPSSSADNATETIPLLSTHTGTGTDLGKVYIRLECDAQTTPTLYTDQLLVAAVASNTTIGYEGGAVWLDTNASNTNTESFVDGTTDNPVSTIGAARTIADNLNLKIIHSLPGSSFTLAQSFDNFEFEGENYTIAFGGQSISNAHIKGATVSGTYTATNNPILERTIINAITGPGATMRNCFFNDVTITNNGTNGWFINDCRSRVAGAGQRPNFDFGAAAGNTELNMRNYSGGIELENMGQAGTDAGSIEGNGNVILNANCAGGDLAVRGTFNFTDNASGAVDTTLSTPILDITDQGKAQSATVNTVTLDTSASSTDGQYDPGEIIIIAGTGQGQSRSIIDYNGTTKVAVVDKDWRTNPDSTSSYVVRASSGALHVNEGQSQAGAATTITLNTAASSTDDIYIGQTIFLVGGTGQDQARIVTDYNGTTKVATVHRAWDTNPDATTSYVMLPVPAIGDSIVNIEADTNELQTDWTDGGRLDTILDELTVQGDTNEGKIDTIDTNVDAILVDTGTTLPATLSTIDGKIDTVDTNVDAILVDTGTTIPAQISGLNDPTAAAIADAVLDEALSGHTTAGTLGKAIADVETDVAAVLVDTGTTIPAQITALNDISAADVNAEVLDVFTTDTFTEPSGVPAASATLADKIGYLYMALRNKVTVTSTKKTFYDDGDAAEWEKDLTDDGTTYTESESNAP